MDSNGQLKASVNVAKMPTRRSLAINRLRRCPTIIAVVLFISTIIVVHLYTVNVRYGVIGQVEVNEVTTPVPEMTQSSGKVRHVIFVKVHKAASTTLMNIFVRFGLANNLTMMIPRYKNILNEHGRFDGSNVLPPLKNSTYDMVCNHLIFNKTFLAPLFPKDTKYIGILREPFEQTVSAFMYYKYVYPLEYLTKIHGQNPVSEYLKAPKKYEPWNPAMSFTNNRMSVDLGFTNIWSRDKFLAQAFIRYLEDTFQLLLIAEYFDESVILMKRLLNWDTKDVLYISSNSLKKGHDLTFTPEDRLRHKKWAWLDHAVYDHFYQVFWDKVHEQGKDFYREVQIFKDIRRMWQSFCSGKLQPGDVLKINETAWNADFLLTEKDCKLAKTEELPLMNKVRSNYYLKIKQRGVVLPYVSPNELTQIYKKSANKKKPVVSKLVQRKTGEWVKQPVVGYSRKAALQGPTMHVGRKA